MFYVKAVKSADSLIFLIFQMLTQYLKFYWERYYIKNAEFSAQMPVGGAQKVPRWLEVKGYTRKISVSRAQQGPEQLGGGC